MGGGIHAVVDANVPEKQGSPAFYTRWSRSKAGRTGLQIVTGTTRYSLSSVPAVWRERLWLVSFQTPTPDGQSPVTVRYRTRPIRQSGRAP
jgi:hypothetical protein